jgi:hypothetical protein
MVVSLSIMKVRWKTSVYDGQRIGGRTTGFEGCGRVFRSGVGCNTPLIHVWSELVSCDVE